MKIPWGKPCLSEKEQNYILQALDSTWISDGEFITRFENDFSNIIGRKYGVTCSNGTSALHLALLALGIKAGDEVIIPTFTFASPANMTLALGATPIYADVDPHTWCIDPIDVKRRITNRTKAIIAVHLYGNVCDMDALISISKEYGIPIIEDVAEALFSQYNGRYAGNFGVISCFSFQSTKTITMGEGGIVLTNDPNLYKLITLFRNHGMSKVVKYWHEVIGFNYRLTNTQAAIGCAQLERRAEIISKKRHIYDRYISILGNNERIHLQFITYKVDPVIWATAIHIDGNRESIVKELEGKGIETRIGFFPFCMMPVYHAPYNLFSTLAKQILSLPSFTSITDSEIDYVCSSLCQVLRNCP